MNKNLKVSVYVPVYNGENTIELCIKSLLNQSKVFDEIIVVNDASSDSTSEILKKFKDIRIISNKSNLGLSKSRNIAINECKYDIVANVDSDIVLDEKWLEKIFEKLIQQC